MGNFLQPEDLKSKSLQPLARQLEVEDLDDRFIVVAERRLEEAFNLDLDTDDDPRWWSGIFFSQPHKRDEFRADYRRATLLLCEQMLDNSQSYGSQSRGGASVSYTHRFPPGVRALMHRWARPNRLYRT